MAAKLRLLLAGARWLVLALVACASGCITTGANPAPDQTIPRELNKASIPEYRIGPPDVLLIDTVRLVPRPPYRIVPLDALLIQVTDLDAKDEEKLRQIVPGQPIDGLFRVEPDGVVNLRFDYGSIYVAGQTIPEAKDSIYRFLKKRTNKKFDVWVALGESQANQQVRGEHLVRPDGKITLGTYGSVHVAGMTLDKAKGAIQAHLAQKFQDPEISLDIGGFNSMVYYVIFDLYGRGQYVTRLPYTGNETVLDAISRLNGLPPEASRCNMWVARPTLQHQCEMVLPVDWQAITRKGITGTNYQLLPGDRVYVAVDPVIAVDGWLAKVISPIERVLGVVLLGSSTVQSFQNNGNGNNNNNNNGF